MNPSTRAFRTRMSTAAALVFAALLFSASAFAASTIEGSVYDNRNSPLADVNVELLNEYGQSSQRSRTDGSGRYRFDGVPDGRYAVRAMPFTLNFQDQTQPVEVRTQNIRGGEGTGFFQIDFYLKPKRLAFADSVLGVVFAQEVPPAAEKSYERAVKELDAKRVEQGYDALNESIRLFPNHFNALHRMGQELYQAKRYKDAIPFFIKAADVNAKSITTLYYLGMSLHYAGPEYNKAALTALSQASIMAPSSMPVLLAVGTVERAMGKFTESEKHLLLAKKLAKGEVPEIHKQLAQLYSNDLKKYKEAADELEAYLKASKPSADESKGVKKQIENLREKAKAKI